MEKLSSGPRAGAGVLQHPLFDLGPTPSRTETMVEKLLTNWLSICLYAFLKVRVSPADAFSPQFLSQLPPVAPLTWAPCSPRGPGV